MDTSRIDTLEIVVTPAELRRSATGSITGRLWLRLTATRERTDIDAFPGDEWSDFPVTVLGWWLGRLARDTGSGEAIERCQFMDGPFAFTVRRRRGVQLRGGVTLPAGGHLTALEANRDRYRLVLVLGTPDTLRCALWGGRAGNDSTLPFHIDCRHFVERSRIQ